MKKRFLAVGAFLSLYFILWTSYSFYLDIPYDAKRLVEGLLLVIGVAIICTSTHFQEKWFNIVDEIKNKGSLLIYALGALFLIGLISAALSNYPKYAFLEVSHFFLLFNLIMLCVIGYLYKPAWFEYGFLSVIGLMAGLYLINVTISYAYTFFVPNFPIWPSTDFIRISFEGIGFRYPEPFRNFINVRFFNQLQTWSLPLLTFLVIQIPKRYWAFQKIAFIIACGWWMLVFASDARGTMVSSFVALGFVFFIYRTKAGAWLRTHSISAAAGLVSYFVFFKFLPVTPKGGRTSFTDYTAESRFDIWEYGLQTTLENPLLGVGPMHFNQIGAGMLKNPHNIYLQFFSEWGIPAGILFLAIVILGSYKWYKSSNEAIDSSPPNSNKVNTRVALTASLLAALIHGLVSNIFNTPMSQVMMVLVLAWMIGLSLRDEKKKEPEPVKPYARYGVIGLNFLAACYLIWSYSLQVPNLDENRRQYLLKTQTNQLYPRYWDQGIIGLEKYDSKLNEQSASE